MKSEVKSFYKYKFKTQNNFYLEIKTKFVVTEFTNHLSYSYMKENKMTLLENIYVIMTHFTHDINLNLYL